MKTQQHKAAGLSAEKKELNAKKTSEKVLLIGGHSVHPYYNDIIGESIRVISQAQ